MKRVSLRIIVAAGGVVAAGTLIAVVSAAPAGKRQPANKDSRQGMVQCANLFCPVKLGGKELFEYPFAVMTGEGAFTLTPPQRQNLRNYVMRGGFLVASAGCSSSAWDASFRAEMRKTFPKMKLKKLPMSHPIFHTVYDVQKLRTKSPTNAYLEALEIDGKIALVYSHEGLNDTQNAGPGCCCCGGNEILNSREVNANLLAYALTH